VITIRVAFYIASLCIAFEANAQDDFAPPPDIVPDVGYDDHIPMPDPKPADTSPADDLDDDSIIRLQKTDDAPKAIEYKPKDRQKACAKYNNKFLSIYGEIYRVKNCIRHLISDPDSAWKIAKSGAQITEVDSQDLAALPVGEPWETKDGHRTRSCTSFNNRYVTFSYTDIYFVEKCVKRLLPDYETFLTHSKTKGLRTPEVIALTYEEFNKLKSGDTIKSVIDKEFAKVADGSAGIDIIPVDEACQGLESKYVSFYSRIYKIEKCRKREMDAENFTRKHRDKKLTEMKPEQWLSLPDGKPLDQPKDQKETPAKSNSLKSDKKSTKKS
jgi:uncharacterized short protein YbdD (DUF466 family)